MKTAMTLVLAIPAAATLLARSLAAVKPARSAVSIRPTDQTVPPKPSQPMQRHLIVPAGSSKPNAVQSAVWWSRCC